MTFKESKKREVVKNNKCLLVPGTHPGPGYRAVIKQTEIAVLVGFTLKEGTIQ